MLDEVKQKLHSLNYLQSHNEALRKITGQSGQWFLRTEKFVDWEQRKNAAMLGLGDPGVGKTCLVSLIISHLQKLQDLVPVRVAYIYLCYQEAESQTPTNIISTLLKQLLLTYSCLPGFAITLYQQLTLDQGLPNLGLLVTTLINLCKDTSYRTFLVIDAFDEVKSSYQAELVEIIKQLVTSKVQVFITSRPSSEDLGHLFNEPHTSKYFIRATTDDISWFLKQKLEAKKSLESILDEKFKTEVIQTIRSKSQGVYVLFFLKRNYVVYC
ncbi:hypothetical protein BDN72DRAFT_779273 [Pluteus cervinus]|uniref:Uncharacterized protein n=1 Tax=Pluteus cervinus TaxID=181527 RepID=A0ACD3A4E3_9AGAR|nr:hypothetical protein BDN72DRAFT_779273 [Pluteus cervinus]